MIYRRNMISIWRVAAAGLVGMVALAGDWPQLLGPQRNGTAPEPITLKNAKLAWKKDVGAGFSSPVVVGGKLILHHRNGGDETVECLRADTGERIWKLDYATTYRD